MIKKITLYKLKYIAWKLKFKIKISVCLIEAADSKSMSGRRVETGDPSCYNRERPKGNNHQSPFFAHRDVIM